MDMTQNEFNECFTSLLKEHRPELTNIQREECVNECAHLEFEFLPPDGGDESLFTSTEDREVTVFYHEFHMHFSLFYPPSHDEIFAEFLACLDEIMGEEKIFVGYFEGDDCRGCEVVQPGEKIEPHANLKIVAKSWKGTYSQTMDKL